MGSSLFDRLPNPLGDDCRILVQSEQYHPLEALWASNDETHSATKWISSIQPSYGSLTCLPPALHGRFDPFSPCGGDSLAVEDQQRHLNIVHLLGLSDCRYPPLTQFGGDRISGPSTDQDRMWRKCSRAVL